MYSRVACVFLCIVWCICAVLVYFYPRRPLWAAPRWPVFQLNPNFLFPEIEQLSNYTITQLLMVTGESMEQLAWPSLWRAASQSQHFMLYNWSIFPTQIIFFTKMFHSNISFKSSELRKYSKQISLPSLLSCKQIFTIFISSKAANYSRPCCSCFLKAAKRSNSNIIYISSELRLPYSTKASPKFNFNFFHLTSPKIFKPNTQPKYSTKNIQPNYLIQNHKLFPSYLLSSAQIWNPIVKPKYFT